jgi:hypothetical protein
LGSGRTTMADYKVKFLFADAVTVEQEFPGGVVVRDAKSTLIANWPAGVTRPNCPPPPMPPHLHDTPSCSALHAPWTHAAMKQQPLPSPCRTLLFRRQTPAPCKFAPHMWIDERGSRNGCIDQVDVSHCCCCCSLPLPLGHSPHSCAINCRACACGVYASSRCDYAVIHSTQVATGCFALGIGGQTMTNQTLTLPDSTRRQGSGGEPGRY